MKFELQHNANASSGAIVNCSSLGGLIGGARRGVYHAPNTGFIGLNQARLLNYATRGIRVNDRQVWPRDIDVDTVSTEPIPGQTAFNANAARRVFKSRALGQADDPVFGGMVDAATGAAE